MSGRLLLLLLALLLSLAAAEPAQSKKKAGADDHLLLCHQEFVRIYRVATVEKMPGGQTVEGWTRWFLIDDRRPADKEEIDAQLKFYRENHIAVEFKALQLAPGQELP